MKAQAGSEQLCSDSAVTEVIPSCTTDEIEGIE